MSTENKKGCLSGCLVVFFICFALVALIGLIFFFKGGSMMKAVSEKAKVGIVYSLTEDHTDLEKKEFQEAFNSIVDSISATGLKKGIMENQNLITKLSEIIEDRKINKVESREWLDLYKQQYNANNN